MTKSDEPAADAAQDKAELPGRATRAAVVGRALLGLFCLVGGMFWILVSIGSGALGRDLLIGLLLVAGGLVLVMPHRVRLPRIWGWAVPLAAGLAGSAAGLAVLRESVCCDYVYVGERGFPIHWLSRVSAGNTAEEAQRLAVSAGWSPSLLAFAMSVVVWAMPALLLVTAAALTWRAARARAANG